MKKVIKTKSKKIPVQGNMLLVAALVITSFFTGFLWFKVQALQQKQTAGQAVQAGNNQQPQPQQNLNALPPVTDKDHIRGSKDAKIILVEYGDFECPFCKRFQPTMQQVLKEYGNEIAWVYRHFPLSFHQNAQKEAEAAECVTELGGNDKFWEFADKIYEKTTSNGTGFQLENLVPLAQELGLDNNAFQKCLDSGKYAKLVKDEEDSGAKAGINGTPGTFIVAQDGKKDFINGALLFDQVKQQIDVLLK